LSVRLCVVETLMFVGHDWRAVDKRRERARGFGCYEPVTGLYANL